MVQIRVLYGFFMYDMRIFAALQAFSRFAVKAGLATPQSHLHMRAFLSSMCPPEGDVDRRTVFREACRVAPTIACKLPQLLERASIA